MKRARKSSLPIAFIPPPRRGRTPACYWLGRLLGPSANTPAGKVDPRAIELAKSVTIQRDSYGVPHVYGRTDAACVFGFIYAQAEDYFWQIEDNYIRSLGRAAEVAGEKSLPDDLVNRAGR